MEKKDKEEVRVLEGFAKLKNAKTGLSSFAVFGVDIVAKHILIDFGISALSLAFEWDMWLKENELQIIELIFNKRYENIETWYYYTKNRPDFKKHPLIALQTYEITKFFGNSYAFWDADFVNTNNEKITLSHASPSLFSLQGNQNKCLKFLNKFTQYNRTIKKCRFKVL